jgi:hypothetical protein
VIFFNLRPRSRDGWLDKLAPFIKVPEHYKSDDNKGSSGASSLGPQRRFDGESALPGSDCDNAC